MFSSLLQYRQFIWRQAVRDLRHRYAGTGLGVGWNVIHPLGVIAIYSIVFTSIMPQGGGKASYVLYLCCGFFPWLAFSDCVTRGCSAFVVNANYLKKLPIPEQVFVAQSAVTSTLGLAINYLLLMIVALLMGFSPSLKWLLLPLPLLLMQFFGFGAGMMLGTLNVFFRDIGEWTSIALQMAMWTLPIVYVEGHLPRRLQEVMRWHPLMPALRAIHELFLQASIPTASTWIAMAAWPLSLFVISSLVLHKLRPEIRDVI